MAVPRKRKKLAETAENLKKNNPRPQDRKRTKKAEKTLARNSSQKIDTAFEIMDHIEEEPSFDGPFKEKIAALPVDSAKPGSTMERLGFRFHLSLDAVMPEKRTGSKDRSSPPANRSSILDIGLTIPFFWKMPIIGDIAQKVIRNIRTLKW
ncbi:MAG: hypothetical protein ABIK15_10315 [Pseudomonadota bacterium]